MTVSQRLPGFGVATLAWLVSGCASVMSGLDGSSSYACKAPEGVHCDSVSGTYYNSVQNNLPAQRRPASPAPSDTPPAAPQAAAARVATSARPGADTVDTFQATPLRAAPRIWRLWIKPWEDADHDLNDESFVYVQVDGGRWLVDHVQRQAREPYAPIRPAQPQSAAEPAPGSNLALPPARRSGVSSNEGGDEGAAVSQALRALPRRPAGEPR